MGRDALTRALLPALQDFVERRDEEDAQARRGEHSGEDRRTQRMPRSGAGTARQHQRSDADDEGKRRHQDRPEPQSRCRERRLFDRIAGGAPLARELHDQHRILCRQPNEHDQANLHVDVVVEPPKNHGGERAEDADRHAQDHRRRHSPAFVQRGEREKDEQHRKRKDDRLRVADGGLLIGDTRPAVPETLRQRLLRDVLHRRQGLTGAIP